MNSIDISLLLPPLLAGLLVLSTHVPLGRRVLDKGIIFIDLAIAQVAALGFMVAGNVSEHFPFHSEITANAFGQIAAALAASGAALVLTWSGRRWPRIQEALIGLLFVLAACIGMLLLAHDPHGGEHLTDLLAGQILWVNVGQLLVPAAVYAGLGIAWLFLRKRLWDGDFYLLFALAVTVSVQLVGVFLVFTSLIAPAIASRHRHGRSALIWAYGVGLLGYAIGLLLSALLDLPAGPAIAACLCLLALTGLCKATPDNTPAVNKP